MQIPYITPSPKLTGKSKAVGSASVGVGFAVPPIPNILPPPTLIYQYGGKDNFKDKTAFNKHLNQIRETAITTNQPGQYNPDLDEFYSVSNKATYHEKAHRFDLKVLGNPSQQKDFQLEIDKIPSIRNRFSELGRQEPSAINFYGELYATLWEIADGDINNIPPSIRKFYTNKWNVK